MHRHNRRFPGYIVLLATAFALLLCRPSSAGESEVTTRNVRGQRPNIVIFLADDQGWGDLSCHGNSNLATPNIDSLARDGAMLENFYVCAVCAPTRAEFLTGRYHFRTGVSGVSEGAGRLNPDEVTLTDLFKAAGYATGAFGKWHNGTQAPYHPLDRGFDEFYGFTSGHWGHYFSPPLDHNRRQVTGNGYLPDDVTDHAVDFIQQHHDRPFFCYVPYNTPHSPFYVDDNFYAKFAELTPAQRHHDSAKEELAQTRAALAMCENIDWNVGRILKRIDELQLRDNTIVLYFSDNGPNSFRWNGGMKGKKGSVDEGGLRSPFLIRWPRQITAGKKLTTVSAAIDLLPTLTTLAGISAKTHKPLDGRSFAQLLTDDRGSELPDRDLFSVWGKRASVRTQQFRLDQSGALFDITEDRRQAHDIATDHAELATRLRKTLKEHHSRAREGFAANRVRPFTVGYANTTTLPARDGIALGTIKRSAKAPNNSFFTNWTRDDDSITWNIHVGTPGRYRATVLHTCPESAVGTVMRLSCGETQTEGRLTDVFDPPIRDKSQERVAESHYFVKDFRPINLGTLKLSQGQSSLTLSTPQLVGSRGPDVYSIVLDRMDSAAPNLQTNPNLWVSLFNGVDLAGWQAKTDPGAFRVNSGVLTAHATHRRNRGHLFAVNLDGSLRLFRNFELVVTARGEPNSNSGLFFHTDMATRDGRLHLKNGYEIQLNSTAKEKRKTGSLYDVQDLAESAVDESDWFTVRVKVEGQRIRAWINDKQTVDYTQPQIPPRSVQRSGRLLRAAGGAIALQAHDANSKFHFRDIRIRELN